MNAQSFMTATLRAHPRGADVAAVLQAAISAVDPYLAVRRHLHYDGRWLRVGANQYDLHTLDRITLLAIGKAALPMAHAALDVLGERVSAGLVVPKAAESPVQDRLGPLWVIEGAHPIPDRRSLRAGQAARELLQRADDDELILVLLSGGGSSLLTWPEEGITLEDMRVLTAALLRSGATIDEFNLLRRRCDRVKGGGLLRAALPARVAVLVLSDVVGDDLGSIASGPFVADVAGQHEVQDVLQRYKLTPLLPESVVEALRRPPPPVVGCQPTHTIVGNVEVAARGALAEAERLGIHAEILSTMLRGEARVVGADLARRLLELSHPRPACLIAGGETTVSLHGNGLGGRNQELALAAVESLAGRPDLLLVALATDGGDGPTDAAGAVVGGATLERGHALGMQPRTFLERNDAYHYFDPLGDLLKPGPTQTNVNDLVLLFALDGR
jgi:glycerate 2-kinase